LVARVAELEAENRRLREHIAALEKEARKLVAQIERLAETIETPERNRGGNAMSDSLCKCRKCGREERVNFSYCLTHGWPACCGQTMMLEHTDADIDQAVGDALAPVREVIRGAQPGQLAITWSVE